MDEKIIKIIEEILEKKVNINTKKSDIIEWDSLNHVRIIAELQEEFNISFSPLDIDKINSVKDFADYILTHHIKE